VILDGLHFQHLRVEVFVLILDVGGQRTSEGADATTGIVVFGIAAKNIILLCLTPRLFVQRQAQLFPKGIHGRNGFGIVLRLVEVNQRYYGSISLLQVGDHVTAAGICDVQGPFPDLAPFPLLVAHHQPSKDE
jgi:hypothetical protein